MSEMVERVARAICEVDGECWEKLDQWAPRNEEGTAAYYIRCARAAIAAMREPTPGMCRECMEEFNAMLECMFGPDGKNPDVVFLAAETFYKAMIDEALK